MKKKHAIWFILFFLLTACTGKRGTLGLVKIPHYRAAHYMDAEEYRRKGDIKEALQSYKLSIASFTTHDSIPYWWKAKIGQGEIRMQLHKYKDAEADFTDVVEFAEKHRLDSALYLAHRNLSAIAYRDGKYQDAHTHIIRARQAASAAGIRCDMEKETLLASAAYTAQNQALPDSVILKLQELAHDSCAKWKANALAILVLHADHAHDHKYLKDFIQAQKEYHDLQLHKRLELLEHEKALLNMKLNEKARSQQNTLFTFLTLFALITGVSIYAILNYKRKHETDNIRLILRQKEEFINLLEHKKNDNVALLQSRIHEKEKQMEQLEHENKRIMKDLETLFDRIQRQKDEQRQQEEHFNQCRFFDTEIGKVIPTPENPYHPSRSLYEKLLAKEENRTCFIATFDICFNGFATRLQKLTPELTEDDIMYCCLFKLNVRTKDIALMVCLGCSTISTRRKRIEMKMGRR